MDFTEQSTFFAGAGTFPFPIKLTYDDDYVYLTPLKIPDGLKQYVTNPDTYLVLCLEFATPRRLYKRHGIPSTTGKFYLPSNIEAHLTFQNFELGTTYRVARDYITGEISGDTGNNRYNRNSHHYDATPWVHVRGAYRTGRAGKTTFMRTQYNSNMAKLT